MAFVPGLPGQAQCVAHGSLCPHFSPFQVHSTLYWVDRQWTVRLECGQLSQGPNASSVSSPFPVGFSVSDWCTCTLQAMTLMEYLIKTGSERVSQQCKENMYAVQTLKDFQYVDRDGKDQGVNVREKAKQLVALLRDEDRLREERAHALKTKEKLAQTATGEVSLPLLEVPDS